MRLEELPRKMDGDLDLGSQRVEGGGEAAGMPKTAGGGESLAYIHIFNAIKIQFV